MDLLITALQISYKPVKKYHKSFDLNLKTKPLAVVLIAVWVYNITADLLLKALHFKRIKFFHDCIVN